MSDLRRRTSSLTFSLSHFLVGFRFSVVPRFLLLSLPLPFFETFFTENVQFCPLLLIFSIRFERLRRRGDFEDFAKRDEEEW